MTQTSYKPGDQVNTPRTTGTIIDIRATPSGQLVYGVEDASGEVTYYTPKALTPHTL